jgi:hypothetical protein
MNLKQYAHQKRRNPLILIVSIMLTFILIVIIVRNINSPDGKPQNQVQLIITTDFQQMPDSVFPVLLMNNKIIIHAFTSSLPKDSTFLVNLSEGLSAFKLVDKNYSTMSVDSFFYKDEAVVFINFKSKP